MIFKTLTIQNFLSIKSVTINLDDQGLVLLKGINLDNPSLNNNGAGKSSIIEALIYALYGRTIRGVKGDAVVHKIPGKNTKVFLDIVDDDGTEYRIARYRKHSTHKNKSLLYRNGKDITPKSESAFNEYIASLLQADYLTFTSSLLYSAESFRFTSSTDAEMKHTFDTMLGLDIYQNCQDIAKNMLKDVENEIHQSDLESMSIKQRLDDIAEEIATDQHNIDQYIERIELQRNGLLEEQDQIRAESDGMLSDIEDQKASIEKTKEKLNKARKDIHDAEKRLEGVKELREELDQVNEDIHEANGELQSKNNQLSLLSDNIDHYRQNIEGSQHHIETYQSKLKRIGDDVGSPCPTCGAPLTEEALEPARQECRDAIAKYQRDCDKYQQKIDATTSEQQELQESIGDLEAELLELNNQRAEFTQLIRKSRKLTDRYETANKNYTELIQIDTRSRTNLEALEKSLKVAQSRITRIDDQIANLPDQHDNPFTDNLKKHKKQQKDYKKQLRAIQESVEELKDQEECLQFWVQAYSNQGIKSFILDDITPFLGRRANKYLTKLSSGHIEVRFNTQTTLKSGETRERFSIDIINQDGGEDYTSNSGGERKRIDLAINLAMQDLVASRSSKRINIAIFDEVFDALDEIGVEKVIELLQELSDEKSTILVISHNEHLQSYFTNSWTIVKKDGFSTLEHSIEEEEVA